MTSKERHEIRFQRRKIKRYLKQQQISKYEDVFSYANLYKSFYLCRKGVRWKASVQKYEALLPLNTLTLYNKMQNKKFSKIKFYEFDINERGKTRHIMAETIDDRCCQKALCENYLNKVILPKLIFDNSASIKNKGTDFALRRIKTQLLKHYKKYGNAGYIFQFDFSKYFSNINHSKLLEMLKKDIKDKNIYKYIETIIDSFGDRGLGLGSQVSQICAIYYTNIIDRYFKEVLKIKGYGRYMDDGYAICKDLEEAKKCKKALEVLSKELDLPLNTNKVTINKLNNTFVFLKKRIILLPTGKVLIKINKKSAYRARRKLRKLHKKQIDITNVYNIWYGICKKYDNYYITKNYNKLYNRLKEVKINE